MLTPALTAPPSSSSCPTAAFPFPNSVTVCSPHGVSVSFPLVASRTAKRAKSSALRIQASSSSPGSRMIEKEVPEAEKPPTFLRETDESTSNSSDSVRGRFEKMIREAQDSVCAAIEAVDGGKFKEDVWSRPGGGGGISRVLQDGSVWEKAGVNVSVVYGVMPPEAYRAAKPTENGNVKPGPVPFFAAGISSVLHPKNPFAPTLHFNYRYFETDAPKGENWELETVYFNYLSSQKLPTSSKYLELIYVKSRGMRNSKRTGGENAYVYNKRNQQIISWFAVGKKKIELLQSR